MDGRRRSASSRSTEFSAPWASAPARLMEVVVLPSPTPGLEMAITESAWFLCRCSTTCRSARYCSASRPEGDTRLTRWLSTSPVMLALRRGPGTDRRRGAPDEDIGPLAGGVGAGGGCSGIGGGGPGVGGGGAAGGTCETGGAAGGAGGGCSRIARSRWACSRAFENLLIGVSGR